MSPLDELMSHLSGSSRAIIISVKDVDLRPGAPDNRLFVLKIGEGSLAAGGRGGGFGERRVTAVMGFDLHTGEWTKIFEAQGVDEAAGFEVPYHVSRLPVVMANGEESMGYGVIDPDLVSEMTAKSGIGSSA